MNTLRKNNLYYVIYFILLLLVVPIIYADEQNTKELTADEILAKSQEAMTQPLHYKITNNGMEMSVYQKMLPDGKVALLMDISHPVKKTTMLVW